ncbi:CMRF35-like molecule 6 [Phoenicopterus ruber ruber]
MPRGRPRGGPGPAERSRARQDAEPRRAGAAMQLLSLLAWALPSGCWAVRGPGTVRGFLGGSLSVNCTYGHSHDMKPKFWCKPGSGLFTCDTYIVVTSEHEPVARWGRVSIQDNRAQRMFTVTMKGLAEGDAGTYRCGVRMGLPFRDISDNVEVIVSPVQSLHAPPHAAPVAATAGGRGRAAGGEAPTHGPAPALPPTTLRPPAAGTDAPRGSPGPFRYFPALAGLQVLALVAMSGAVLWVSLRGG